MLSWYNVFWGDIMTISKDNARTQLTINKELKKEIEKLALKDNRSFNNYIITVLETHLKSTEK